MRRIKFSNKHWIFLFTAVAALCFAAICLIRFVPHGNIAVIYEDGKEVQRIDLSAVQDSYTIILPGNTILVEPGQISMMSANCPDKLCVKQGTIHSVGRIVCLPNRIVIEMKHGKETPDARVE